MSALDKFNSLGDGLLYVLQDQCDPIDCDDANSLWLCPPVSVPQH
jgi:hypothetical protein